VSAYSPKTQQVARSAQTAAEWTRSACGAYGIEGGPYYLYAAVFFDLLGKVAKEIAEDPPRSDFTVSTQVRRRFATPQYIETDDPPARAALETAEAANWSEAHLGAHLRAFERLQGARRAGRNAEAAAREEEAVRHARTSDRSLRRVAARVGELARQVEGEAGQRVPPERRGRPQLTDVDDDSQAILFRGGLRIQDLESVLRGTDLEDFKVAPDRLRSASDSFEGLAAEMASWEPPSPAETSLPVERPNQG
jgi:hypothetical protein